MSFQIMNHSISYPTGGCMKGNTNKKMLYVQHWSFKTGYHQKGTEKFLAGGGDYPGVEMIGRYHAPGSLELSLIHI